MGTDVLQFALFVKDFLLSFFLFDDADDVVDPADDVAIEVAFSFLAATFALDAFVVVSLSTASFDDNCLRLCCRSFICRSFRCRCYYFYYYCVTVLLLLIRLLLLDAILVPVATAIVVVVVAPTVATYVLAVVTLANAIVDVSDVVVMPESHNSCARCEQQQQILVTSPRDPTAPYAPASDRTPP